MKQLGEKVLSWFIVSDDADDGANDAAQNENRSGSDASSVPTLRHSRDATEESGVRHHPPKPMPVASAEARRSYADVYQKAGLSDFDHERLTKVVELVSSLPADAAPDVKRTIVAAALQAFGVPIDRICETANECLGILDKHVAQGQAHTNDICAQANARIAKLTAEIEEVNRLIAIQEATQSSLVQTTHAEKRRITAVLAFFDRAQK